MAKLSVSEARDTLSAVVSRVAFKGERVMLHRHGKSVAALVSVEDMKLLTAIEDKLDMDDAHKALKEVGRKGTTAWTKLKTELGL